MTFLHGHGVGPGRAVRIYKVYGSRSIEAIRENPYDLIDNVPGFGFKLADELAQRLGNAPDSELRCRAGVVFTLQEAAHQGHTLLPESQLHDQAVRLLTIDGSKVENALLHAIASGALVEESWYGERHLALKWLRDAERGVARQVDRLQHFPVAWDVRGLDLLIYDAEHESGQNFRSPSTRRSSRCSAKRSASSPVDRALGRPIRSTPCCGSWTGSKPRCCSAPPPAGRPSA
jgi:exodeoxyribonuclease V alpha subunit